jgi:hypothetical protein
MPLSSLHQRKKMKNLALLILLLALVGIFFTLGVLKFAGSLR